MYLNIIEVLDNDGSKQSFNQKLKPFCLEFRGADLNFPEGTVIEGNLKNFCGTIVLRAKIEGNLITKCSKCSNDAKLFVSFDYVDEINLHNTEPYGIPLEGTAIKLDDMVYKAIYSELPMQILCNENCRGICTKCGANLNEADCSCDDETSDPRWDILKSLDLKDEV